jgi:hypothetical protein
MPKGAKKGAVIPVTVKELDRDEREEQAARISSLYRVKEAPVPAGCVAPTETLRRRIMAMSLFPNVHNKAHGTD